MTVNDYIEVLKANSQEILAKTLVDSKKGLEVMEALIVPGPRPGTVAILVSATNGMLAGGNK